MIQKGWERKEDTNNISVQGQGHREQKMFGLKPEKKEITSLEEE